MSTSFDTRLQPNCRNFDPYGRRRKITEPFILGYFSVNQNREFIPDHSKCKYLILPPSSEPIHFDLNEGYENVQHKPKLAVKLNLDHILRFILLNLKKLTAPPSNTSPECTDKFLNFDIICFRGKLRLLMCTPYAFRDGWSLLATKYKGNIYLCEYETDQERAKRERESEESKKICSYGFKFEQFVMSDSPTIAPDTTAPVLEAEEFCCMFTTKLEQTRILFGAEMDGIETSRVVDFSQTNPNDLKFAEVKVRIKPSNQRQIDNFQRFKTLNWWCQSYLVKVRKIVVGLRTEAGIVDKLESMNVDAMPMMYERFWSDTVCMEFLNQFLCMIKDLLRDVDCPHTVYQFNYDPRTCSSIQCDIMEGPNDRSFIPTWYIDEVQKFHCK